MLAALLLDDAAIHEVLGVVDPADFFREQHRWIFEVAIRLAERGDPITVATVAHELDERGLLDRAGAEALLLDLGGRYFTAIGASAHARIVARDSQYRRLIDAAAEAARLAYRGGPDPALVQEQAEALIRAVGANTRSVQFESAADVVSRLLNPDYAARELVPTGLEPLDRLIGGFGLGDLVVIGAHTSHGKTALAAQVALNMIIRGERVGFLAVEGNDDKLVERMAAMLAGFTRAGALRRGDLPSYEAALAVVGGLPLVSVPPARTPRTMSGIAAWITSMARGEGVRVFFVDHIDAVDVERGPGDSVAGAYQAGLRRLQNTASRERVAIVYLSQVNRGSEEAMPSMRSLRESGAKEELAQLVLMLWLDYRPEEEAVASAWAGGHRARFLHARVEKHTEGSVGDVVGPLHPESGDRLPPFVLNLDSMTVEVVRAAGRPVPAVQPRLEPS